MQVENVFLKSLISNEQYEVGDADFYFVNGRILYLADESFT